MICQFYDVFKVTGYPSGETHVQAKALPSGPDLTIIAPDVTCFRQLGHVVSADGILKRAGRQVKWAIPFFPFARDDRRETRFDGFELGVAMKMVEDLDVVILDPHSYVAAQLPHVPQSEVVRRWMEHGLMVGGPGELRFLIPDEGATKKAHSWLIRPEHAVQASKRRDPATGELFGFRIEDPQALHGKHVVIVDDLCDGGGTFLGLVRALKVDATPKSLTLAVTHGLFTKGTDVLFEQFDRIFTTGECADPRVIAVPHKTIIERSTIV